MLGTIPKRSSANQAVLLIVWSILLSSWKPHIEYVVHPRYQNEPVFKHMVDSEEHVSAMPPDRFRRLQWGSMHRAAGIFLKKRSCMHRFGSHRGIRGAFLIQAFPLWGYCTSNVALWPLKNPINHAIWQWKGIPQLRFVEWVCVCVCVTSLLYISPECFPRHSSQMHESSKPPKKYGVYIYMYI